MLTTKASPKKLGSTK